MKVIAFCGYSGAGKTRLVEALVGLLRARGQRVAAIKHAHHGFDMEREGKDSWRFRQAGAHEVVVTSPRRLAQLRELEGAPEPSVHELIASLHTPADWVLIEGLRRSDVPRVEVWRTAGGHEAHYAEDAGIRAVATDDAAHLPHPRPAHCATLDLNSPAAVLEWLLAQGEKLDYTPPAPAAPQGKATPKGLMPLDEALRTLLDYAQPLGRTETVKLLDADGRVLARDCVAALNVPALDNAAMDGWALRAADVQGAGTVLPVSARIAAGQHGQPLAAGSAARIFTGAPVPEGADSVVQQEHTETLDEGARVRFLKAVKLGQHVRRAGEDVQRGACVLRAGERLTPAAIGMAASLGLAQLEVAQRPRVALLCTGDELREPGSVPPQELPPGALYNSNRYALHLLLRRLGCEVRDLGHVPDGRAATQEALARAAEGCDLIITSGGVSVGEEDHVRAAVQQLGELHFWRLAIKPGKPFAFGRVQGAHFIGLPGNPVSSYVTFLLLVRPFVLRLAGAAELAPPALTLRAAFDWKAGERREFLRVRRTAAGSVELFANQGSGVLTSLHWADGLLDVPAGCDIARGSAVRFLPLT